jgi:hypothetical protein
MTAERAELDAVLHSQLFTRSPALARLLSYLCEKTFAGESDQIKEYSVALDVFGRSPSFDQESNSIVRVEANRLRKRLAEYYRGPGAQHALRITIPVGQYVPVFATADAGVARDADWTPTDARPTVSAGAAARFRGAAWALLGAAASVVLLALLVLLAREHTKTVRTADASGERTAGNETLVGLPAGEEVRILAGASRSYVDHAGKFWSADQYYSGGVAVRSPVQHIWLTQDAAIYRTSRQGDFRYDIPLKAGVYELHLHFAETFYGPEDAGGGGEGSRIMKVSANGNLLITEFDVLADAGAGRTADVKVFTDISPANDGKFHLAFASLKGGAASLSAIEILPGVHGEIRPIRIASRDGPYYSNSSQWWSPDSYFRGGQLGTSGEPAAGTDETELYETERWGHFSYSIPVAPGRYTIILHFIERHFNSSNPGHENPGKQEGASEAGAAKRLFNVFCNGKAVVPNLNIVAEAGPDRPLVRKITGIEPNAQGKLQLDFEPVEYYATVTAIEIIPQ